MKEMNEKLQLELRSKYQLVYGNTKFFCGDGWFEILNHLGLILSLCITENKKEVKIASFKAKQGILYTDLKTEDLDIVHFVKVTENLSLTTCEECGNPGTLHSSDFETNNFATLETLCEKHALEKIFWEV